MTTIDPVTTAAPLARPSGMVLGKFLPPHLGHVYLIEFARRYAADLTVVVGSLQREPIPGALRHQWMRELFPHLRVVHLTDENPQHPSEHPDFWQIWRDSLLRVLPAAPDLVFASEPYGLRLAAELGARFIPVDRGILPVSGTAIRADPLGHFRYLPAPVRRHYLRRVCVFGPESTGKTTLCQRLAQRFGTIAVPEYARGYLEAQGGRVALGDMEVIARGQIASEEALADRAERVLFCDTDVLTTRLWSEALFGAGQCPAFVAQQAEARDYDLYLLLDVDVPYVPDPVRYLPDERQSFFQRCEDALRRRGRRYVVLRGDAQRSGAPCFDSAQRSGAPCFDSAQRSAAPCFESRFAQATAAVEELLRAPHDRLALGAGGS